MSWIEGTHPTSGEQWRLFQAINFTYIPRAERKRFMNAWMKVLGEGKPTKFTWKKILAKYPYLKPAIRRYLYKPSYYINSLEEIPLDRVEKVVISTFSRDFSKKITTAILSKYKKALKNRFLFFKTKKHPRRR